MKKLCGIYLAVVSVCATPVFAATLYVDGVNGNDSNNGLGVAAAFQTLQKAANSVAAGDTVQVMNGTYTNTYSGVPVAFLSTSGTASAWITFQAFPGHKPLIAFTDAWQGFSINANYIIIDGFEVQGNAANVTLAYAQSQENNGGDPTTGGTGIFFGTTNGTSPVQHHVIIRNNIVHHCPGGGIATGYADYVTIQNNIAYDNAWWSPYGASGISVWTSQDSDTNTGYKNYVTGNIAYGNEEFIPVIGYGQITDGNGIIIDSTNAKSFGGRTYVANNIVYSNGGSGIHAFSSSHVDIVNNTAYMNNHSPAPQTNNGQIFSNSGTDVFILNNILYAPGNRVLNSNWSNTNVTTDYNIDFGGTSIAVQGPHDVVADPLYVNAAASDFHLQAGSPAIGGGTSNKAPATDIAGAARAPASIDRGAYVFVQTINTPPVITSAASASPNPAAVNASVAFTVAATDADGDTPTYSWAFGDGGTATGAAATHAYTSAGNFTATAAVSDGHGNTVNSSVTVTVNALIVAPVINSAMTATGTVGSAFSYAITATNNPASFNATGLPNGLTVNAATGVISGTPTAAGTSNVTISATNAGGTGAATLSIAIAAAPQTVHVAAIAMSLSTTRNGKAASATVTVKDGNGAAVGGVIVSGAWNGLTSASVTGKTGTAGTVKFTSARTKKTGAFTFTITNVTKAGYTYASSQNAVTSSSITTFGHVTAAVAGVPVAVGAVSLGSVSVNQAFTLPLPLPVDVPAAGVHAKGNRVPTGVRVSGAFIRGRSKHAGTFTFTVQFQAKAVILDEATGKSDAGMVQAEQQFTITVTP